MTIIPRKTWGTMINSLVLPQSSGLKSSSKVSCGKKNFHLLHDNLKKI